MDRLVTLTKHLQPQLAPISVIRELDEPRGESMTLSIALRGMLPNRADSGVWAKVMPASASEIKKASIG
jgi:hypothetical protein